MNIVNVRQKRLEIGNRREVFWDDYIIDKEKTTAFHRVNQPVKKECCFVFEDEQWVNLSSISYPCIVKDDKGYKMYYGVAEHGPALPYIYIGVIESTDGINWTRPELNIFDHPELKTNNIVLDHIRDSAFFFYDKNPDCPDNEKYKAVGQAFGTHNGEENVYGLWCWTSPDGYHFNLSHMLTNEGRFDSLNTVFWKDGVYHCYFRNFHNIDPNVSISKATRDVRYMFSMDNMKTWSKPVMLEFNDDTDIPLYTNNAEPYERAPHITVGFPVRYCERTEWTENVEQFKSVDVKRHAGDACEKESDRLRTGLVTTDCIFMCSRDGASWYRYKEAFMTPGYEDEDNWTYGDCYLAYSMIDGDEKNYYMYDTDCHLSFDKAKPLNRYEIRKDGFACMMADGEDEVMVTKPFIFEGTNLHLNFSTSAFGSIYIDLLDEEGNEIPGKTTFEIYGDTVDRKISFADGSDFSEYSGKAIRLRFRMRDCKIYSMKFA